MFLKNKNKDKHIHKFNELAEKKVPLIRGEKSGYDILNVWKCTEPISGKPCPQEMAFDIKERVEV